jgi:hypothetical protein
MKTDSSIHLESIEKSLELGACLIVMQSRPPVVLLHQLCQFHELQAVVHNRDHVVCEVWDLQAREHQNTNQHCVTGCTRTAN